MKYIVRAIVTVDLEWECEAENEEEALRKFWSKDATELVNEGLVLGMNTDNETARKTKY